jgi:hypothetical protein
MRGGSTGSVGPGGSTGPDGFADLGRSRRSCESGGFVETLGVAGAHGFGDVDVRREGFAVPPELLEPVSHEDIRGIDRDEAALVLDGYLHRLSREEATCRLILGRLADSLLRMRAYHRLGFARLSDYAVERLGVSGRELQSAARVWCNVERLPALARA